MLYAAAGLLTVAAMLAVQPEDEAEAPLTPLAPAKVAAPPTRQALAPTTPTTALMPLPARPFSGAGRSPFGETQTASQAQRQSPEALAAAAAAAPPAAPVQNMAPALPFSFLGRWTENGITTVYVTAGGKGLPAVAGKPLTREYFVEAIGARDMRLLHRPSGTRHTLALVVGATPAPGSAANAANAAPAASATEEQN
jgi:hypothetical protein